MARPGKARAPTTALHYQTADLETAGIQTGGIVRRRQHPHPTPATPTSASLEVLSPTAHRVSATSPRTGLGETAYTTSDPSLCTNWILLPNTQVGRVSLLNTGGSTSSHQTLPNIGWPVETCRTIHYTNYTFILLRIC